MINSNDKGKRGELEVVAILNGLEFPATRNGCYAKDDVTCFYGGQDLEPTIIEVKRKKMSSRELEEELKGRGEVWHRENNTDWKVTLKAKDYLAIRLLARQ